MSAQETGQSRALVLAPEIPLVTAKEAREQWEQYQQLRDAVLQDEDYLFFLEWEEAGERGRVKVRRKAYSTRADCEAARDRKPGSRIKKRMIKSACRKMAKFFGINIPEQGQGQVERFQEGDFIVVAERGDYYTHTEWLHAQTLQTLKASTTVFIISQSGRRWMGRGGSHQSEGFADDFAVGETAFTRAVNRAVLDMVGWGEQTGEETRASETLPGEEAPTEQEPGPPMEDIFGPGPEPTRDEGWAKLKRLLKELPQGTETQVMQWFRERKQLDVTPGQLRAKAPAEHIPTAAIEELLKALEQYRGRQAPAQQPQDEHIIATAQTKAELITLAQEKFGWTVAQMVQHLRKELNMAWDRLTLAQFKELREKWSRQEQ